MKVKSWLRIKGTGFEMLNHLQVKHYMFKHSVSREQQFENFLLALKGKSLKIRIVQN